MKPNSDEAIFRTVKQIKFIGIAALIALVLLIGVVVFLDRGGDSFENSARYRPPPESLDTADGGPAAPVTLPVHPVQGQTIYVPAYSHIYHKNGAPILLTVTLSVRNTSQQHYVFIESVKYFDTNGKEVKSYLKKTLRLAPLATTEFLVEQNDTSGGSGANFLVQWVSDRAITNPVVEAVMIDTTRQQGISFARSGVVVRETPPPVNPAD